MADEPKDTTPGGVEYIDEGKRRALAQESEVMRLTPQELNKAGRKILRSVRRPGSSRQLPVARISATEWTDATVKDDPPGPDGSSVHARDKIAKDRFKRVQEAQNQLFAAPDKATRRQLSENLTEAARAYLNGQHEQLVRDVARLVPPTGRSRQRQPTSKPKPTETEIPAPRMTGAPGRPTKSMDLIEAELRRRKEAGRVQPKLAVEAMELLTWLRREHASAAFPTIKTIENRIRATHRAWKPKQ